jgi:hypothetical protein
LRGEFQAKIGSERNLREIRAALEKEMSNVKMRLQLATTGFAEAVVGAAVRAALGKQANSAASEPGEIPANASPASGWAAIRSVSPRHFGLRSCLRPQFQLPLEPPEIRS